MDLSLQAVDNLVDRLDRSRKLLVDIPLTAAAAHRA